MKSLVGIAFISLLLASCGHINGHKVGVINNEATQFQIREQNDTINFIVADTNFTEKKPLLLFCQGSMPRTLFIKYPKRGFTWMFGGGISNFYISGITKYYHLVVISKPKTPVIVNVSHLNKKHCYIPDTSKKNILSTAYLKADYLQNYVNRANKVLDFLKKQSWVDADNIVIMGHSQGSTIAPEIALSRDDISCIGLFSADPFGRLDEYVRQARLNADLGKISWEKADSTMKYWYKFYKKANNPDSVAKYPKLKSWSTFGGLYLNDWLKLKIPIYLAYGTSDITSQLCDVVPLYFIRNHKTNLTIKRYIGLNHNYFEVDKNGEPIFSKSHWSTAMENFVLWSLKHH